MKNEVIFKEYMAMLCELHNRTLSKLLTDLYWKVLEPFTDEQCEAAFKEIIYTGKFFPKPHDFIEALQGSKKNKATEIWIEVLSAVERIGNYQSVKFPDPVTHSIIQAMGGWPQLCMMESDEVKWKQKEFERLHEVIAGRGGDHPDYLPGTHEIENFKAGHDYQSSIVRIGFVKKEKNMMIQ